MPSSSIFVRVRRVILSAQSIRVREFFVISLQLILYFGQETRAQSYVFSTIAGRNGAGYVDGSAATARFWSPYAVAVGADGIIYVAESSSGVIRKIAPNGTVSTLAGSFGQLGYVDGTPNVARLGNMGGIAVDASNNVYVTDSNMTIRKILPSGVVSTLAGTSNKTGSADGNGSNATFNRPAGLAVDRTGNVYVADEFNHTVRKISPAGVVSTFAGTPGISGLTDGTLLNATLRYPHSLAIDKDGNVYALEYLSGQVRKLGTDGIVTSLLSNAVQNEIGFNRVTSLCVDSFGTIYIPDWESNIIYKLTKSGSVSRYAGSGTPWGLVDGPALSAQFFNPMAIAVDSGDNLIIADTGNTAIRRIDSQGMVTTIAGESNFGTTDGIRSYAKFSSPLGLAIDGAGNTYVADTYNHTIRKIDAAGNVTTLAGLPGSSGSADGIGSGARFYHPADIAVDSRGYMFVTDAGNRVIRTISPQGVVQTFCGQPGNSGFLDGPSDRASLGDVEAITVDADGNVFFTNYSARAVRRASPTGTVTTIAGGPSTPSGTAPSGTADGSVSIARFRSVAGIAVDTNGDIFIVDTLACTIRKITKSGIVSTLAGSPDKSGFSDGVGTSARFNAPRRITIDPDGNLFVTDAGNYAIRRITPDGIVTTVGGSAGTSADGIGTSARFGGLTDISADPDGNLYIVDAGNCEIRKAGKVGVQLPRNRLLNLSVRATLAANSRLITGFVVAGGSKSVLFRAIGPGLTPYIGNEQPADDPRIELYDANSNLMQTNDDWGGSPALANAFDSVGAFPLLPSSRDAAAVRTVTGLNSAHVLTRNAGLALVEAYDAGTGTATRLVNVSALSRVGSGADTLIAGFVIEGAGQKTLLIRGLGAALASYGVSNALANPRLEIYNSLQQKIAENDDWSTPLASTFAAVGAFSISENSKDAALLISLPPGLYSAQLSGVEGATGEGMVEIYEVGN